MTEEAIRRSGFLQDVSAILQRSAPRFDYREIARTGLEQGVLGRAEAEEILLRGAFPEWVLQGLNLPTFVTRDLPEETLIPGTQISLSLPRSNAPDGDLLRQFSAGTLRVKPVRVLKGGPAHHFVQNFSKVTWGGDGVYPALSDRNGRLPRGFLDVAVPVQLSGQTLMAVVEGSSIYTHWLLDTFPRFLALVEAGHDLAAFDHIVLADASRPFHQTMLKQLGIALGSVVTRQRHGPYFHTEAFTYVTAPRTNFVTLPRTYDMVCAHFGQPQAPKGQTRRFFVSRSGAGRRKILNEEALFALLEPEGFEMIRFEDHGMEEMAALMAQASHIIAPHGAGLANLVFCRSGARVLEIFSAHLSREYWIIAQQKGLDYHAFEAEGPEQRRVTEAERRAMPFLDRNGLDIHVPLGAFWDYLKEVFLA